MTRTPKTGVVSVILRARNRWRREICRRLARRPARLADATPVISFSFDDFPSSALAIGGRLLMHRGVRGTYYAALGLLGQDSPTGLIAGANELRALVAEGHELGCHTYSHCHAWETFPPAFARALDDNRRALTEILPGARFTSLSYPISGPRPGNKRAAGSLYSCCRGGGQSINAGLVDLNYVQSFFLEQSRESFGEIIRAIELNRANRGWLIFSTHDVTAQPTRFGVTPELFEATLDAAVRSGAQILPVAAALQTKLMGSTVGTGG